MSSNLVDILKAGNLKLQTVHELPDWYKVTEEMNPPCAWFVKLFSHLTRALSEGTRESIF